MQIRKFPRIDGSDTPSFCMDDCIATYTYYLGAGYERMYLGVLKNRFCSCDEKNNSIGDRIRIEPDTLQNLEKYEGIIVEQYTGTADSAVQDICSLLNQKVPVLAVVSGYHCPWDWRYQVIEEGTHMLLVDGIDEEKQVFCCTDPYYEKERECFPIDEFLEAYKMHFVLRKKEADKIQTEQLLMDMIKDLREENWLSSMKKLPEEMLHNFDLSREIQDYDQLEAFSVDENQDNVVLNKVIKEIVHNRIRFAVLLNSLGEEEDRLSDLKAISQEFVYMSQKWNMVRIMLLKRIFARKTEDLAEYLSKKLAAVLEEEEVLIDKLAGALKKEEFSVENSSGSMADEISAKEYVFVNISKYMNHIGIGGEENCIADFNNEGEYFLKSTFPSEQKIECNGVSFSLMPQIMGKPDNIACSCQRIELEPQNCKMIAFLGCGEWGDFTDDITLVFADGKTVKRKITLYNWVPDWQSKAYEKIAVSAEKNIVIGNGDEVGTEECYLYSAVISTEQKELQAIILPECINMHIFAISLAK